MNIKNIITIFCIFNSFSYSQIEYFETKLPIIIIETYNQEILDEPKVSAHMGIIFHEDGSINKTTDYFNNYNGRIGIEIRGSTSQNFPKKSFAIETWDSNNIEINASLLGLPEEGDWILYGPYSDKSLLRNVLTYEISRQLGDYASRTKFCELILNSDYIGIYVLTEKLKRDKNRIDIAKLKQADIDGNELTGGYVIKIDKTTGLYTSGWESQFPPFEDAWQKIFYQYHSPKPNKMVSEQKQYIQNWIYNFESVMYNERNSEIQNGYDWLDLESAVDYFLISELVKNKDAYYASIFMYKDKDNNDPKLHLGPVWDINLSMGNNYDDAVRSPEGWRFEIPLSTWELNNSILNGPFWFNMLWEDSQFREMFKQRWISERNNILSNQNIINLINQLSEELSGAVDRNFTRWEILGIPVWPMTYYDHTNYVLDTYDDEVQYLKDWITERLVWIDSIIENWSLKLNIADENIIQNVRIHQIYPNPSNSNIYIKLYVNQKEKVTLSIYDVKGRQVLSLYDDTVVSPGLKNIFVDTNILGTGVYFVSLSTQKYNKSQKFVILK